MNNILTLDCTLRDGGYCNQWNFKENNIKKIITALVASNIDIIECGYLTNRIEFCSDVSKYTSMEQLGLFLPRCSGNVKYVLMMNVGEYEVEELPRQEDTTIDGIRVAFHKKNRYKAIDICKNIMKKGYKVFVQPMVSMLYSRQEFEELVELVNELKPFSFYIVDSFGMMNRKDLDIYFEIADNNLSEAICLGFHSHNNLQSAFSNVQYLLKKETNRKLIIDSSIYGMGRGAGNLNSELFLNELNAVYNKNYEIRPLLRVMDEVINRFYEENPWGYSLPNYLSAIRMIHPSYAEYLSKKKTLTIGDIDEIFDMMDSERAVEYDEKYISDLYIRYMSMGEIRREHLLELKENVKNRSMLLVAPGRSAIKEEDKIKSFVEKYHPIIMSINHDYPVISSDYIFVSNIRRFSKLEKNVYSKTISTSNIKSEETYASVDYYQLLNFVEDVRDNACLMAIKFVVEELGVCDIYLAGLDGYSHDIYANFETREMALLAPVDFLDRINDGMRTVLNEMKKTVNIKFITPSIIA